MTVQDGFVSEGQLSRIALQDGFSIRGHLSMFKIKTSIVDMPAQLNM